MHRTAVICVVGLTPELLGPRTPRLSALAAAGAMRPLSTVFPAVTCTVQATLTTGLLPAEHGAVANGWYFRDLAEVLFWRQSAHLVSGERIWDAARKRDPAFTAAKLFWWFNMYGTADLSATPRPIYWADGLKLPDFYTEPPDLHEELVARFGPFPLFDFWGPNAGIPSSAWIAGAARWLWDARRPTLMLAYLPHLDYDLQRLGPADTRISRALSEIDEVAGELIAHLTASGARVIVLSEYGITPVAGAVFPNRALREAGFVRVRMERGLEKLDAGASEAFAVADHQVAHVYVKRPERVGEVARILSALPGVEAVLDAGGKRERGVDHPRSGDLVLVSAPDRWFAYYWWLDDACAPEYARTVDIHRKPGYDPVELFLDPALVAPKLKIARRLLQKKIGMRYLLDVIPLDASLVKGSHGRLTEEERSGPLIISSEPKLLGDGPVAAADVKRVVLDHLFA